MQSVFAEWSERVVGDVPPRVAEAMAYSLAAPGKCLRPALLLAAYEAAGGTGDATELAAAVEAVHTYSLVHDDLPCMDDDHLRRGRATTHRQFDAATATEAGFRLVPLSARILEAGASRLGLDDAARRTLAHELYGAAGARGMIGGQVLDLEAEGRDLEADELEALHGMKTGALITASVVMGGIAAGATGPTVALLRAFGEHVGLAFQIVDDVLDATGTSRELGKTAGKDAERHKASFAAVMGPEPALAHAHQLVEDAVERLRQAPIAAAALSALAHYVVERTA